MWQRRLAQLALVSWLIVGLLALLGEILAWASYAASVLAVGGTVKDPLQFYTGAELVRSGRGGSLYDIPSQAAVQAKLLPAEVLRELQTFAPRALPFLSLPFVALVYVPLLGLGLPQAYVAWGGVNWLLLGGLVVLLMLMSTRAWGGPERLVAGLAAVTFPAAYYNQLQGQITLLAALSASIGWLALGQKRETLGGFALAFLLVKPQYAILVPIVLGYKRRWRALVGFLGGVALLLSASWSLVGWDGLLGWVGLVSQLPSVGEAYAIYPADMVTWSGLVSSFSGGNSVFATRGLALWIWVILVAGTLCAIVWLWRVRWEPGSSSWKGRFAGLLLATVLISPHTYYYDLVVLIPAGFFVWDAVRNEPRGGLPLPLWVGLLLGYQALVFIYIALQGLFAEAALDFEVVTVVATGTVFVALIVDTGFRSGGFRSAREPGVVAVSS